jgi:hypothetical protein
MSSAPVVADDRGVEIVWIDEQQDSSISAARLSLSASSTAQ